MEIKGYRKRIIDALLDEYLATFGAVSVEGPKWCGKTWTSRFHAQSEFLLSDPKGNFNNRRLALTSPSLVLEGAYPRLIDEWQEVPTLWDAVRNHVDSLPQKGQFILTGSASIHRSSYIHSGTGRIAHLRMRPMSLYESGDSTGVISLHDICEGKAPDRMTGEVSLLTLAQLLIRGGWPSSLGLSENQSRLIAQEYIKSILTEDIYKTDDVKRDAHKVELLLRSLARNESTTATMKTLVKDISEKDYADVSVDSIADYLNLFSRLYLIENIPPYSNRLRSSLRVKQSEKHHFVDPSLPCAILSLTKEKLIDDLEYFGFLFESLVERDLLTYADSFSAKVYHYQDYENNEIDAILELQDGSWCGFEIKLGANEIEEGARNLVRINQDLLAKGGKGARSLCVICGLSNASYRREDGVYVVPITALKD
ncbi:MAG: DUF4143 domain-containing protein [Eubacteriales bacterium]|nr:DUF4143 domain-containing protein [Eubacteriales bacterium]